VLKGKVEQRRRGMIKRRGRERQSYEVNMKKSNHSYAHFFLQKRHRVLYADRQLVQYWVHLLFGEVQGVKVEDTDTQP
jgi:hypothetical protein